MFESMVPDPRWMFQAIGKLTEVEGGDHSGCVTSLRHVFDDARIVVAMTQDRFVSAVLQ